MTFLPDHLISAQLTDAPRVPIAEIPGQAHALDREVISHGAPWAAQDTVDQIARAGAVTRREIRNSATSIGE